MERQEKRKGSYGAVEELVSEGSAEFLVHVVACVLTRLLGDDDIEDGIEKSAVLFERGGVARGDGGLDGFFSGGSDELDAADEDARELSGSRIDGERKNRVSVRARDDIDEAAAFFKPGVAQVPSIA